MRPHSRQTVESLARHFSGMMEEYPHWQRDLHLLLGVVVFGGILGPKFAQRAASLLVSCVHHSVFRTDFERLQSLVTFVNTVDQDLIYISNIAARTALLKTGAFHLKLQALMR